MERRLGAGDIIKTFRHNTETRSIAGDGKHLNRFWERQMNQGDRSECMRDFPKRSLKKGIGLSKLEQTGTVAGKPQF